MTQPVTVETDPPVAPPPAAPAASPASPAPRPMTVRDVVRLIEKYADTDDITRLPGSRVYAWLPQYSPHEASLLVPWIDGNPNVAPAEKGPRVQRIIDGMRPTMFLTGKACELNTKLTTMWIFKHGDAATGEVHLYCLALKGDGAIEQREILADPPPTRFRLSRGSLQFDWQTMPLETWALEVSDEWDAVNEVTAAPGGGEGEDDGEGVEE